MNTSTHDRIAAAVGLTPDTAHDAIIGRLNADFARDGDGIVLPRIVAAYAALVAAFVAAGVATDEDLIGLAANAVYYDTAGMTALMPLSAEHIAAAVQGVASR